MNMKNPISYRKFLSILSVLVVGMLIFGNQLVSIYLTVNNDEFARQINLAGRQRMLSQKIAKAVLSSDSVSISLLLSDVSQWQQVHQGLQSGDFLLKIQPVSSPEIGRQLHNLDIHVNAISSAIEEYVKGKVDRSFLKRQVATHEKLFLDEMDHIVFKLEADSEARYYQAETIESGLTILSLTVLVFGFFFVFKPIYRRMVAQDRQLKQGMSDLQQANTDLERQINEAAQAHRELQTAEEELRQANEEQHCLAEELEVKMNLSNQYNEQLAAAQETAKLGYWSYDLQEKIVWSEQMYTIFGIRSFKGEQGPTYEEFIESMHPEDRELSRQKMNEAVISGEARYNPRIFRKDGRMRYLDSIIRSNTNSAGEVVNVFGVVRDITDDVRAREALIRAKEEAETVGQELIKTKELLEETGKMAKVGGWEIDLTTNKVHWTAGTREIHEVDDNYQPEMESGINFYKEGKSREVIQKLVNEAIETGQHFDTELELITAKGNERWVRTIGKADFENGDCIRVYGTFQDITQNVKSHRALINAKERAEAMGQELVMTKELLEQTGKMAKVGGWEIDPDTNKVYWTAATREIHEIEEGYEIDVTHGLEFYKEGASRDTIQQAVTEAVEKGKPYDLELEFITARGNKRWVRTIGKADFENGKCTRLYGTFQDITQSVKAQKATLRSKEIAENAVRVKQEFLANMSHEIRTPMNAILGFSRILLRDHKNIEQREYLQSIYDSADSLLVVVNDILDFSKIEAGKLTVERVHFRMDKLLKSQKKLFSVKVNETSVNLIFDTDQHLPEALIGDPVRINQVLNNLIGNAIKFTEKGQVKITTRVEVIGENRSQLRVAIQDTGIGIAPDKIEKIFNSFVQEKGDTTRKYGGTGLGLSIVKQLVELMEGEISVESEVGQGSTFTLTLPLQHGDVNLIHAEPLDPNTISLDQLCMRKILLAEDNRNNQMLAKKCLTEVGCIVDIAPNGAEALRMVKEQTYDIVLMDIQMPIMDGMEATQAIKALPSPQSVTPIIAMTAHALKEEEERYLQLGMCDYISKPFKPQLLYTTLLKVLEKETLEKAESSLACVEVSSLSAVAASEESSELPFDQIEYGNLRSFASGDEGFVKEMLHVFLEDVPEYLRQIEVAMQEQNWKQFKEVTHTLKSSTSFLGMKNLTNTIEDIEALKPDDIQPDFAEKLYDYISKNCQNAMKEVENGLK